AAAVQAVEQHLDAVVAALEILSSIHDPRRIIVGGPVLTALLPLAVPRIRSGIAARLETTGGTLHFSELGNAVGAIGAACLFLEAGLSPGRRLGARARSRACAAEPPPTCRAPAGGPPGWWRASSTSTPWCGSSWCGWG